MPYTATIFKILYKYTSDTFSSCEEGGEIFYCDCFVAEVQKCNLNLSSLKKIFFLFSEKKYFDFPFPPQRTKMKLKTLRERGKGEKAFEQVIKIVNSKKTQNIKFDL